MDNKLILAIESSCDETAASLARSCENDSEFEVEVLSNVVASQIDLHRKWGGVYPELASRAHLEAIIPVIEKSLEPIGKSQMNCKSPIDNLNSVTALAVTVEPGLIGSLLVGIGAAKILGTYFNKPIINVNHLEGHIYSAFATNNESRIRERSLDKLGMTARIPKSGIFPILALVVSGGHTSLIVMKDHLQYETVGQTIDDAAGEAFDKVARMIGLGYPGGPEIEKVAKRGKENVYKLPLSMKHSGDLNFSFSGLKTAVLYLTKEPKTGKPIKYNQADLAASFQKTVTEILIGKTIKAIEKYNPKTVILTGGVSANGYLRERFQQEISLACHPEFISGSKNKMPKPPFAKASHFALRATRDKSEVARQVRHDIKILIPPKNFSTDNAVGIAVAGAIRFSKR